MDRTSSVPKSVLHLKVDKGQGLRSGILFFTSLVLLPNETRVKTMDKNEIMSVVFFLIWAVDLVLLF